jgi:hypothetical protein
LLIFCVNSDPTKDFYRNFANSIDRQSLSFDS